MRSSSYIFAAADLGVGADCNKDAVDGFAAIAAALDQGLDHATTTGGYLADAAAILCGWLVLAAVIFFPALQLVAIALCALFMGIRSVARVVFGAPASSPRSTGNYAIADQRILLAA